MSNFLISALNNIYFAFRLENVIRVIPIVHITKIPMAPSFLIGLINLEGETIPVINLYHKFGFQLPKTDLLQKLVIVRNKNLQVAILLEEASRVVDQNEEQMVKPEKIFKGLENILENVIQVEDETVPVFELGKLINELEYAMVKELVDKVVEQ